MDIRTLTIDDYESVIELWKITRLPFKPRGRDARDEMEIQMKRDPDLFIGAFAGNKLIGVILGTDDGRKGWINRLAISPENTRQGVAIQLIGEIENALKKRGRRIICTLVEEPNEASFALFKKAGYIRHDDIHYLTKRENDDV